MENHLHDVEEEKSKLQEQVVRDPLTGVFNRRFLDDMLPLELSRAAREGYPVAIIMLDLDHFKRVNDRYSHAAGDEVLKSFTALLRQGARDSDMVCRYGGEEFVVIMPRMSVERAGVRSCRSW
jgi:diguanylate cyclase (GGDEF)-like protein